MSTSEALSLIYEEGEFNEDGGSLGYHDFEEAVALGCQPIEDPVARAYECGTMG